MKKILAILLVVVLTFGSAFAASDSEGLDSRLKKVTLAVKNTLDIDDTYTQFDGSLSGSKYAPYWSLNWQNGDGSKQLSISADESGKIYSYNYYENNYYEKYYYNPYFAPAFPSVSQAQAKEAAMSFIKKVLGGNESITLVEMSISPREIEQYSFYGTIKVNGLDSPFGLTISVRTSDLAVIYFSRDDLYTNIKGGYPQSKPSITPEKANELLSASYEFEPIYVLTDNSQEARLVYVPRHNTNYVVDALTGELVDSTRYYPVYDNAKGDMGSASAEASSSGLTPAELEGISKLEGVYTPEELDSMIRKISIIDVNSNYELQNISYYQNRDTGEVTAYVYYWSAAKASQANDSYISYERPESYKFITIDAKAGKITSLYTSYYYYNYTERKPEAKAGTIPADVVSFIKQSYSAEFSACELYSSNMIETAYKQENYTYCQKVNGYFYPGNSINVSVNSSTGKIDSFSVFWDEKITFEKVSNVVAEKEAAQTYAKAFEFKLGYTLKSEKTENEGYNEAYSIILSYTPYFDGYITGVSAVTGKLVSDTYTYTEPVIRYDDIDNCYGRDKIKALSEYGIGYYDTSFKPTAELTQKDMILLLISADGAKYRYNEVTGDIIDQIYETAYYLGILKRDQKNPDKKITRAEMVRILVSMSGYGKTAELKDIYICGFKDDDKISNFDYGYVAIGKGLGIISGDKNTNFRPNEYVSRQDAAIMLYNFMSRNLR